MQNHTIEIVTATEADLLDIAELAGVVWRAHYPGIIAPAQIDYMLARMYSLATLRAEVTSGGIRYDRLLADGKLIGFAACGPTETRDVMKLHKLYLHPAWQGRGLGSRLLAHCERGAGKAGATRLILAVNKRNAKAMAAYRRNGFTLRESVTTDIGGGFVMDDFILEKNLGS